MAVRQAGTVLVLRALGLGDLLTGIPALRGLRRAFPDARLLLAAPEEQGHWLQQAGIVDGALPAMGLGPLSWTGSPPGIAVNLHGRGPQSHRLLAALAPARMVAFACPEAGFFGGPPWPADVHEVDRWCGLVQSTDGRCDREDLRLGSAVPQRDSYAVLHPGASATSRCWPASRWAAVAAELCRRKLRVLITGGGTERQRCAQVAAASAEIVDLSGRLDLRALAETVAGARLLLSGDTGVAHLATAYGVPSVTLFGPVSPHLWGPAVDPRLHRVLWHPEVDNHPGNPHATVTDVRLAAISVDEVLGAVNDAQVLAA